MCKCAYCKQGMSATAEECVDRMVETVKSLKESLRKYNKRRKKWK